MLEINRYKLGERTFAMTHSMANTVLCMPDDAQIDVPFIDTIGRIAKRQVVAGDIKDAITRQIVDEFNDYVNNYLITFLRNETSGQGI